MMKMFLAAITAACIAASAHAATAEQLFGAGKEAMRQNDAEKAADLFEQALKLKPGSSEIHLWLGRAYGSQAQHANLFRQASLASKTRSEFERAVELDPNNIEARMGLIEYDLQAPGIMGGSESKAVEQANEIRKRDSLEGHRALARIANYQKKPELARKEYIDALREQPNSAKAHYFYLIGVLFGEKKWPQAFEELDTILKLDPSYMPPYFQIGHVAAMSGAELARGEQGLQKYLGYRPAEDEPPLYRAWYWLGQIEEKTNRKPQAKQSYTTSLKMNPNQKDVSEALKRVP